MKHWDKLDNAVLVGKKICEGKIDYGDGRIFFSLLLVPKVLFCLTVNEFGVVEEKKISERFGDKNRLLETKKSILKCNKVKK